MRGVAVTYPDQNDKNRENIDRDVVSGFGDEWQRFDQSSLGEDELLQMFSGYFAVFPWGCLSKHSVGFDLGCGSGRWAKLVADRVGLLHCIDPSSLALAIARRNLVNVDNCRFHLADVDHIPLDDDSADFGYSLGVLHHIPDTARGIASCVAKLKRGAPFLVYLYYAFDNRPLWFKLLHKLSEAGRFVISRMPYGSRYLISQAIAILVYWPLARTAYHLSKIGVDTTHLPLSSYKSRSLYSMRTDALDRFGTRLERRFTKPEIKEMLKNAGLRDIRFHDGVPYWCAVGYKA